MSTHLQKSLSPPGGETVLSYQADFMVVVVMVMFTGIFGKIMIGMGFKFALTAGGAEIKLMVLVSNAAVRLVRQDDHPAHGISHLMQCVTLVRG
jgi:hypothetical protein